MKNRLTVEQAARLAGVSPSRIRYLADAGRLPAIRDPVGRRLLLRRPVEDWARQRKGGTLGAAGER